MDGKVIAQGPGYAVKWLPDESLNKQPWGNYIHPTTGLVVRLPYDAFNKSRLIARGFKPTT